MAGFLAMAPFDGILAAGEVHPSPLALWMNAGRQVADVYTTAYVDMWDIGRPHIPYSQKQPDVDFKIKQTIVDGRRVAVDTSVKDISPFTRLWNFTRDMSHSDRSNILIIAPNSGHEETIVRETVQSFLPHHNVSVLGCRDPHWIPIDKGTFGTNEHLRDVLKAVSLPAIPFETIYGPSQGGVMATLASAFMFQNRKLFGDRLPTNLVVVASPIDTREGSFTPLAFGAKWGLNPPFFKVRAPFPGVGRRVHYGQTQEACMRAAGEHITKGGDMAQPIALTSETVLETLERGYRHHELARKRWVYNDQVVDPAAIQCNVIRAEFARDEVAPVGNTRCLKKLAPHAQHNDLIVVDGTHFDAVSGPLLRNELIPRIEGTLVSRPSQRQLHREPAQVANG